MPILDEEGRLFGRVNLVDAVVAVLVAGLIPLAYGGYLLFRAPAPRLTGVEPAEVVMADNLRVKVRGENLRPYMRVSFGTYQGITFGFLSATEALVDLQKMPPGVYDVVLYDVAQERSRLPGALTVRRSPLPDTEVIVVGTLGGLHGDAVGRVQPGMTIEGVGPIVQVGRPLADVTRAYAGNALIEIAGKDTERVPVAIRVGCYVEVPQSAPRCLGDGIALQPAAVLMLATPVGKLPFQIDQVRGLEPVEALRVVARLSGQPEALAQVRPGDVDLGVATNELAAGARVAGVRPGPAAGQIDVTLDVQSQRTTAGWTYAAAPLRIGGPILLRTVRYELQGTVVAVVSAKKP